jgi:hypothetical protein
MPVPPNGLEMSRPVQRLDSISNSTRRSWPGRLHRIVRPLQRMKG